MKLTNRMGLPQAIMDAVSNDPYTNGGADYSVTTLLKPPRIVALERAHREELVEDVSDRIWSLCGQVIHGILERADTTRAAEIRFFWDFNGIKVSGQVDLFGDLIQDYKFVTAYKFKNGQAPREYEEQLNCYALLASLNDLEVLGLEVIAILRDWSRLEAMRNPDYPQTQVLRIPVKKWPLADTMRFIEERIKLHEEAKNALPLCSKEERWAKGDTFAVKAPNRKTAVRVFDNSLEADACAKTNPTYFVEKRPGVSIRCAAYCPVSSFCEQYKNMTKE